MRIFTASLSTETNTFSAIPTGWSCFEENGIERGAAVTRDGTGGLMHLWGVMAADDGHEPGRHSRARRPHHPRGL